MDLSKPNNPPKPSKPLEEYQAQKQAKHGSTVKRTAEKIRTDVNSSARNRKSCHWLAIKVRFQQNEKATEGEHKSE
jgi:hypothetical protein